MDKSIETLLCIVDDNPATARCKNCGSPICSSCVSRYHGYCDMCAEDVVDDEDKYDDRLFSLRSNRVQRHVNQFSEEMSRSKGRYVFSSKWNEQAMEDLSFRSRQTTH